jgi:hypothetical protein
MLKPLESEASSHRRPLGGVTGGPDGLQVPVTKEQITAAPNIEQHGEELSQADESALYR